METTRIQLWLWLFANISALVCATVTVNGFHCEFNKELLANGNCQLLTAKSGTTYISGGITFVNAVDNAWIKLKFLRKVDENVEQFGVSFTQNYCDHKKGENVNFFIKRLFMMGIKQVKGLKCPLLGNLTLPRYRFVLPMAQGFMPPADYLLNFFMAGTKQNLYILDGNISFTVTALV